MTELERLYRSLQKEAEPYRKALSEIYSSAIPVFVGGELKFTLPEGIEKAKKDILTEIERIKAKYESLMQEQQKIEKFN